MDEPNQEITPTDGHQTSAQQVEEPPQAIPTSETQKQDAQSAQPATEQQLQKAEEKIETRMSTFERTTIRLTTAGVVIGIITLLIFSGQLYEMWDAGTQTDKIIAADERLASAMENAVGLTTTSLKATVDQFHLEQRAWVGPLSASDFNFTPGQPISYRIVFQNSGKTPALHERHQIMCRSFPKAGPVDFTYPKPTGIISTTTIQPGMTFENMTFSEVILSQRQVDAIRSGAAVPYLYGKITYDDVFSIKHHTTFCFVISPDLQRSEFCDKYNEAD